MLKFKKIKKTVSLIMALAFCLCALPTVIAEEEPAYALNGTMSSLITIMGDTTEWNGGADETSGQINIQIRDTGNGAVFTAYKLLNITNVNGTLQVSIPDDAQNFWNKYTGKADGEKATIADIKAKIAEQATEAKKSSSIVDAFVGFTGKPTGTSSAPAADGKTQITTAFGFYAILQTGAPVSGYIASAPVLACLPMKKDIDGTPTWLSAYTVQPKDDTISISKQVKASGDDIYKDETITNIGDTVSYEIIAELPTYGADIVNSGITYTIEDVLPDGVTYKADSVSVSLLKKGEANYSTDNTYVPTYTDATRTLALDINNYGTNINDKYDKIKITYSALLNSSAKVESTGNTNTAKLTYSNTSTSTTDTSAIAKVYTMGLDITKIEKDSDPIKTLAGAIFEVYTGKDGNGDPTGDPVAFYDQTNSQANYSKYYVAASKNQAGNYDDTTTFRIEVGADGKLHLDGLNDATYYLKEVQAPTDYNLPNSLFEVTVAPAAADVSAAPDGYVGYDYNGNDINHQLSFDQTFQSVYISNSTDIDLPVTGGMGTVIFTAIGLLLMAGAAYFLFRGKKSSN